LHRLTLRRSTAFEAIEKIFLSVFRPETGEAWDERLGFVLHLRDFIYEIAWYPEARPQSMYDRRLRELCEVFFGRR
jgi:hypothetical protein